VKDSGNQHNKAARRRKHNLQYPLNLEESLAIVGSPPEIQTGHPQNGSPKCCHLSRLARPLNVQRKKISKKKKKEETKETKKGRKKKERQKEK
jgi:hypothetical protein